MIVFNHNVKGQETQVTVIYIKENTFSSQQTEYNENIPVKIKAEKNTEEIKFKCAYFEKEFQSEKGRRIHIGWKHKETQKKTSFSKKCNLCKWIGFSEEQLEYHKKESHIEQLQRKINQDQPNKCYIRGSK